MGLEILSKIDFQRTDSNKTHKEGRKIQFYTGNKQKTGECFGGFNKINEIDKIIIESIEFISQNKIEMLHQIEPVIISLLENYRKLDKTQESIILSLPETGRLGESKALEDLVKDLNDFESVKNDSEIKISQINQNSKHFSNICSLDKKSKFSHKKSTDPQISKNFSFAYLPGSGSVGSGSNVQMVASIKSKISYKTNTIREVDEIEELLSGSDLDTKDTMLKKNSKKIVSLEDKIVGLEVILNREKLID